MRDKLKFLYELKALTGMFFMGEVFIYGFISYLNGLDYINILTLCQLLLLAFIIVIFQYFLFTYDKALRISVYIRIIIHYISMLSIFIMSSNIFKLFNLSNKSDIIRSIFIFTIMYICVFAAMSIYYKITGERFNQKLNKYKNKK